MNAPDPISKGGFIAVHNNSIGAELRQSELVLPPPYKSKLFWIERLMDWGQIVLINLELSQDSVNDVK